MAALTHVCMWSEHGWKRVSAEEAARLHPGGTVSAHSGLFMCDLCGQYVILTDGDVRDRYFKHSAQEKCKDCPDRTTTETAVSPTYDARDYKLPIKISSISENSFSLEIGLVYVPDDILRQQKCQIVTIRPRGSAQTFTYLFDRLNENAITYLSVGNIPAELYSIQCDDNLHQYWPQTVTGIPSGGCLFHGSTGIRLVENSYVRVGEKYILLSTRIFRNKRYPHVEIHQICYMNKGWKSWYVYEVEGTAYEEDAAKFFLDLRYRLSDHPLSLRPVWPPYVTTPYVVKYYANRLILHVSGQKDIEIKSFPQSYIPMTICGETDRVFSVHCQTRQQLISSGITNVLQYLYLWKEDIKNTTKLPDVTVSDIHNHPLAGGILNVLPEKNTMMIETPFDGLIKISTEEEEIENIHLVAGKRTVVDNLRFGIKMDIAQGLDVVWSASFVRGKKEKKLDDKELLQRLREFAGPNMKISHNQGSLADKLVNYPKTKKWFYHKIYEGYISKSALAYLKKNLR